mgnify:CR=1 FL=1
MLRSSSQSPIKGAQNRSQTRVKLLAGTPGTAPLGLAAQTTGSRLKSAQQQHRRDFLETRFAQLLAQPRPSDTPQGRQEEKVRHRLAKQQDHLLTFLDFPALEATNNLAERQLRPVVISRKLSCGNKTMKDATTWSVLASLAATCQQRGDSFIEQVAHAMRLKNRAV